MSKFRKYLVSFVFIISFSIIDCSSVKASNFKSVVDITNLDVYEIQDAIDKEYLTYELLVNLYLDRINEYNDDYDAIISINKDAVKKAIELDKEYQKSGRRSILHGIPIIIKDNIDYTELPTTAGTKALRDSYPKKNSTIVDNLVKAGAIILAKSNMSEFAFSAYNSFSSYGNVKNAYNLNYTAYGSSGGSAVSVASSLTALAIGTDTNSSVRLPASANNIVGLRPTYGLLSSKGIIHYDEQRDTAGPMTKTVADNALLLSVLANNGIDYTDYLKKDGLKDKRIGILKQFIKGDDTSSIPVLSYHSDQIDRMMSKAIKDMEKVGAKIVYIDKFYSSSYQTLNNNTSLIGMLCYDFNQYIKNTTSSIKSFEQLIDNGGFIENLSPYNINCSVDLKKTELKGINVLKEKYRKYVKDIMKKYDVDVLVYPDTKNKLLKLSEVNTNTVANNTYTISPTTGFPAISVPLGFDEQGLPYGIEFLALANQENILYEITYSFEQNTNNKKNPAISPALYTVSSSIKTLKNYYEKSVPNKNNYKKEAYNEYYKTYEKVTDLLVNYNNYDTNTVTKLSDILLKEYEAQLKILSVNKKSIFLKFISFISLAIIFSFIIYIILKKERMRRRRKRRMNRYYSTYKKR